MADIKADALSTISESLRHAVEDIISSAKSRDLGPQLPNETYRVFWMEAKDATSAEGSFEERVEPSFQEFARHFEAEWLTDRLRRLTEVTASFVEEYGQMPLTFLHPRLFGKTLLFEYFRNVPALELDQDAITSLSSQFIDDLLSPTIAIRTLYLVRNFSADSPFSLGSEISFQPITSADIDRLGRVRDLAFNFFEEALHTTDWICRVDRDIEKSQAAEMGGDEFLEPMTAALNLTKVGCAAFRLLERRVASPFLDIGHASSRTLIKTGSTNAAVRLTNEDVSVFQDRYSSLSDVYRNNTKKYLRLSVRRLRTAADRRSPEDKIVDLVIGVESLVASDSPALETTFRFQLRGAALLPLQIFGPARDRIKLLKKLYQVRSRIVHGDAKPADVRDLLPQAESVLRHILIRHLGHVASSVDDVLREIDDRMVDCFNDAP